VLARAALAVALYLDEQVPRREFPRDVLLMQRLYYIYFWQRRSAKVSVYAG